MEMADQEEAVNKCTVCIPDGLNKDEGRNLMALLYEAGFLSNYLDALDAVDENGLDENDIRELFNLYFDLDGITIDPQTGRITELNMSQTVNYGDDDEEEDWGPKLFDLPPTIDKFDSLESITLCNCYLIPIELGNLLQLKRIRFFKCHTNLLENIPEGLQLPSSTKSVIISFWSDSDSHYSLSPLMKILPNTLEELLFLFITTREQTDKVLRMLQHDDLVFRQSLTTLGVGESKLNDVDFERFLFEIRLSYPNLHTINVMMNNIKSVLGIEARIKRMSSLSLSSSSSLSRTEVSNNFNLCKIHLNSNPIDVIFKRTTSIDPKEKAAMLTLLNTFDRISNLGLYPYHNNNIYDPDIEYLLRRNKVNMNFTTTTTTTTSSTTTEEVNTSEGNENTTFINRSLWPLIFERAYTNSHEIYESDSWVSQEEKDCKKCATGLYELARNGPLFAENYSLQCHNDSSRKKTTTTTTTTNYGSRNNNTTLKRKRIT